MRVVILAMLIGCALAASVHEKFRRDSPNQKGHRKMFDKDAKLKEIAEKEDQGGSNQAGRVRRTASCNSNLWPDNQVCFYYDASFTDATMKSKMAEVFATFSAVSSSCITFHEVASADTPCPESSIAPLRIVGNQNGCWSNVGCSGSSQGTLSLPLACSQLGLMMHELFHTLGRQHEQTRPDRDEYVTIHTAQIKPDKLHNYEMCERNLYGLPYDYQSIMHYGTYSFRCSGCTDTMTTTDSTQQSRIGWQAKLSPLDIATLNKMYSCYADPNLDPFAGCENGGVMMPSGECHCEEPFSGSQCEVIGVPADRIIQNSGSETLTIASPGWPGAYPINIEYTYVLTCAADSQKVKLHFTHFDVEDWGCGYDKFRMRGADEIYSTVNCGTSLQGQDFTGSSNELVISFLSDDYYTYNGFQIEFTCV